MAPGWNQTRQNWEEALRNPCSPKRLGRLEESWDHPCSQNIPVLVFQQFIVDLLNVNLLPQDVVVTVDIIDDRVVQVVQLLKQA